MRAWIKKNVRLLTGIITILVMVSAAIAFIWTLNDQSISDNPTRPSEPVTSHAPMVVTELQFQDLVIGTGGESRHGNQLTVAYTGWLYDAAKPETRGDQFDSSDENEPFKFRLGVGQVIRGWDKGLLGMKVGGTRVVIVPASMGYGSSGAGEKIPPNATLIYEVKLLRLVP